MLRDILRTLFGPRCNCIRPGYLRRSGECSRCGGIMRAGDALYRQRGPEPIEASAGPKRKREAGFTLIELMIVVVIVGILAAIALPNFASMQDRAREASTKANMHAFQLLAETWSMDHDGLYADQALYVAAVDNMALAPSPDGQGDDTGDNAGGTMSLATLHDGTRFRNPWTGQRGMGQAWENRVDELAPPTAFPGIVSYSGHGDRYSIKGEGKRAPLAVVMTQGGE